MRYRAESAAGDYIFGPASSFLIDSPQAVAQAIKTRLMLFTGEWFLDSGEGLDKANILGNNTQGTRDQEVQQRILGTTGVNSLLNYSSAVDAQRNFTVAAEVDTIYGAVSLTVTF